MKELEPFVVKRGCTVVELGSRDGHDANTMRQIFRASRTITIEANPDAYADIQKSYPRFENYNLAIGNKTGTVPFWKVGHEFGPTLLGQSSLLYKPSYNEVATKIDVNCMTMDDFVSEHNISEIEVLKIDVEGATFEVLDGFSKIRMTRLLHIESEHEQFWVDQHVYSDTEKVMLDAGYEQVYFADAWTNQSDTIWRRVD